MKKILISLTATTLLIACTESQPAGDEYFDRINSVPTNLGGQSATPPEQIDAQPLSSAPQTLTDADGITYEAVPSTFGATETPAADTAATPAPAKGLYEPALSVPTEGAKPKKKRATKPPRAVELKPRSSGINLREYGASQTHLVGEKVYSRSASKYANGGNCAQYSIAEIAQIAFLNAGGPKKDPLLLDSNGDGFACAWVPTR